MGRVRVPNDTPNLEINMSDKLVDLEVDLEEGLMRAVTVAYLKKEYEKVKSKKLTTERKELILSYIEVLSDIMYAEDDYEF